MSKYSMNYFVLLVKFAQGLDARPWQAATYAMGRQKLAKSSHDCLANNRVKPHLAVTYERECDRCIR
jgi:hypothetical protein